ncbi:MAG TPA: FixH family protein [Cyclobacteriaceae bacterium]
MNWGKGIVLTFIAFAIFIFVLVTVCVKQNITLVSKEYYAEELNYQQQIDELNNAAALDKKPVITVRGKQIEVQFPSKIQQGELKLLRPSDARFDAHFAVDSTASFDMSEYPFGKYNASLRWQHNGTTYLIQTPINL